MSNPTEYDVVMDGKVVLTLNKRLATSQKVTPEQLAHIKALHAFKLELYELCNQFAQDKTMLRMFAGMIELIEFDLQRNWNFPMNKNFHRFWDTPQCKCPKMDNDDAYPTGHYVISGGCLIHGNVVEPKPE